MNAAAAVPKRSRSKAALLPIVAFLAFAVNATAATQLVLGRDSKPEGDYKGIVDLAVTPPADNMKIAISVDGDKLADLHTPYRVTVDFGPRVVEHKIVVVATTADRKRIQWSETLTKGHLPLTAKLPP